jgi:myo-inositol-1(or 4)-monophosphatase
MQNLLNLSIEVAHIALDKLIELDKEKRNGYFFDKNISREVKSEADIIIENIILEKIRPTGIEILSEEAGILKASKNNLSSLRFIIDPIDGTVNFVRGITDCSICIALFDGDKPIFGVIASYPSRNIAWGGKEIGSFLEGARLQVSTIQNPKEGVLCTGFPSRFKFDKQSFSTQIKLMADFGKTRMLGAASQSLLQVAKGNVECYSEQNIMLWDIAAGIAIVEGAGGKVEITNSNIFDKSINVTADNGNIKNNKPEN